MSFHSTVHCACDERENCTAAFAAGEPVPAGWKIARCPCGNPMNWMGDIYVAEPALLCPEHDVPGVMKFWACPFCGRYASDVIVSVIPPPGAADPARS